MPLPEQRLVGTAKASQAAPLPHVGLQLLDGGGGTPWTRDVDSHGDGVYNWGEMDGFEGLKKSSSNLFVPLALWRQILLSGEI